MLLVVVEDQLALDVARLGGPVVRVLGALVRLVVLAAAVERRQRLRGGVLGGRVVARLELGVGLARVRLDGARVARVGSSRRRRSRGGAAPVLLVLAHDGGLERDLLRVRLVLVALRVLAVVLDGAVVLAEALAQHAGAAQRVGGVRVLRVLLGELLVERRRLVVVGDVLLDARGGEQRVRRLAAPTGTCRPAPCRRRPPRPASSPSPAPRPRCSAPWAPGRCRDTRAARAGRTPPPCRSCRRWRTSRPTSSPS